MTREFSKDGGILLNVIIIVMIVVVVAWLFWPVFPTALEAARKAACQNNMKELGLALYMYYSDYDKGLPSSTVNGGKRWDSNRFRVFATKRGTIPPTVGSKLETWPMFLYPYMKNKDLIWCPSDPDGPIAELGFWRRHFGSRPRIGPNSTVSYWYKAAVDRAWFGGTDKNGHRWACKRMDDFSYPSGQVIFYEHTGWHWGDADKGLSNGATLNMTYMDGHVASKRLSDAGNAYGRSDPLAPGEPAWFNYDFRGRKSLGVGVNFDARRQGDMLK